MLESSKIIQKYSNSHHLTVCSIHFNVQPLIGIGWGCCCCSPLLFHSYNPASILQTIGTQLCLSVCLSSDLVTSDTIARPITTSFLLVWWCLHQSINVCKNAVIIYNTAINIHRNLYIFCFANMLQFVLLVPWNLIFKTILIKFQLGYYFSSWEYK